MPKLTTRIYIALQSYMPKFLRNRSNHTIKYRNKYMDTEKGKRSFITILKNMRRELKKL